MSVVRNLITGIHGFAPSHLCDLLLARGEAVFGIAKAPRNDKNIRHLAHRLQIFYCDIRALAQIREILEKVRPQRIYHMASISFVPAVTHDWKMAFETNLFGTLHLLETVKQMGLETRILYVGSSEEYGIVGDGENPVQETSPLKPVSLYGVTKTAADILAHAFCKKDGIDILRARPFNHIGPRQESNFVCSSFARQIAEMETGAAPVLKVGNLDARRDFMDARDTVEAYRRLMESGDSGEAYNVCSGKIVSIRSIVEKFRQMTNVPFEVAVDPDRFRPEQPVQYCGDYSKLARKTGWEPKVPLERSLQDTLDYWRKEPKNI